jgi:hypothetical protein
MKCQGVQYAGTVSCTPKSVASYFLFWMAQIWKVMCQILMCEELTTFQFHSLFRYLVETYSWSCKCAADIYFTEAIVENCLIIEGCFDWERQASMLETSVTVVPLQEEVTQPSCLAMIYVNCPRKYKNLQWFCYYISYREMVMNS